MGKPKWQTTEVVKRLIDGPVEVIAQHKTKPPVLKAAKASKQLYYLVDDRDGWYLAVQRKQRYG